MIIFTKHADGKFLILKKHKFFVSRRLVIDTITNPDLIDYSRRPLIIAQRKIDSRHVLRVVYKYELGKNIVITFYPGRVTQYE
ncbi:MAG: DUF4258 domain-containing protein [Patescibacteria group bacterium]